MIEKKAKIDRRCALCLQTKKLCRSHIIPNFLYSDVYDEQGKKIIVRSAIEHSEKFRQSGYWEWLLCEDCDNRIGEWDGYAAQILQGRVTLEGKREGAAIHLKGFEYAKFKLFQLSIVWRASVASGQFFKRVALGVHEEIIRSMLVSGDPGMPTQYPCLLTCLILDGVPATGVIVEPTEGRLESHRIYRFVFGGFFWSFIITSQRVQPLPGCLLGSGDVSILIRDAMKVEYITELVGRVIDRNSKKS